MTLQTLRQFTTEVERSSRIRALSRDDLPAVASLYERIHRSGSMTPPPGLAPYFARTFLEHPWADPEIPSLVYEDGGRIVGFIGSTVRRLRFDGQPIRMACSGPFFADPDARSKSVGPFLLRSYMRGPQDLTITDGASEVVRRMWERFGGECLHLSCVRWTRVFRPTQCIVGEVLTRARRPRLRDTLRPALRFADSILTRVPRNPFRTPALEVTAEPLTPDLLIEQLHGMSGSLRLYPDYDPCFLGWLFDELQQVKAIGKPCAMLVRDKRGMALGWYVCLLRSHGLSRVLQIAAPDEHVGRVLDHLFAHASDAGVAGLVGRLEPRVVVPLATRRCMLHCRGEILAMIHSRMPEITAAIRGGRALLTRLEGETWFGHWSESFGSEGARVPRSINARWH